MAALLSAGDFLTHDIATVLTYTTARGAKAGDCKCINSSSHCIVIAIYYRELLT